MKWLRMVVLLAALVGLSAPAFPASVRARAEPQTVTIPVDGMTCVGCERDVESAVSTLPGIIQVKASYRKGNVVVQYDPDAVTPAEIVNAITTKTYYQVGTPVTGGEFGGDSGQAAAGSTAVIRVEGMTDDATVSLVTRAMGAVEPAIRFDTGPRILDVSADTSQSTLTVKYDPALITPEGLIEAIRQGGFEASLASAVSTERDVGGFNRWWIAAVPAAVAGAAILGWYIVRVRRGVVLQSGRRRR